MKNEFECPNEANTRTYAERGYINRDPTHIAVKNKPTILKRCI